MQYKILAMIAAATSANAAAANNSPITVQDHATSEALDSSKNLSAYRTAWDSNYSKYRGSQYDDDIKSVEIASEGSQYDQITRVLDVVGDTKPPPLSNPSDDLSEKEHEEDSGEDSEDDNDMHMKQEETHAKEMENEDVANTPVRQPYPLTTRKIEKRGLANFTVGPNKTIEVSDTWNDANGSVYGHELLVGGAASMPLPLSGVSTMGVTIALAVGVALY